MDDREARFARRLGLSVGMWDWWRIKGLHTPYEWAIQLAADYVDPQGSEREDIRAAVNTTRMVFAQSPEKPTVADYQAEVARLTEYLPVYRQEEKTPFPDELEQ